MLQNLKKIFTYKCILCFFCNIIGLLTNRTFEDSLPSVSILERYIKQMANIKSSKKRVLIAEKNAERNVAFKSSIKTAIKKTLELAKGTDKEALNAAVSKVYQLCDKAVVKGILHKNTAARKKSRLTIALNKIAEKV